MLYDVSFETKTSINQWRQLILYFSKIADTIHIQYWKWEDIKNKLHILNATSEEIGKVIVLKCCLTDNILHQVLAINNGQDENICFSIYLSKDKEVFFYAEHYGEEYHILGIHEDDVTYIKSIIPNEVLKIRVAE